MIGRLDRRATCPRRRGHHRQRHLARPTDGDEGSCLITEDRGNHRGRIRFMAGSVDDKRFGIDAGGEIIDFQ